MRLGIALILLGTGLSAGATGFDTRPEARAFAAELAERRQWDRDWILAQLREAKLRPAAQRLEFSAAGFPGSRSPGPA